MEAPISKNFRVLKYDDIVNAVAALCVPVTTVLSDDVQAALRESGKVEKSEMGIFVLDQIEKNQSAAAQKKMPLCQDTGVSVFFVHVGSRVVVDRGTITDAINDGVRKGYKEGFLRSSVCSDPLFERKNTGDNTPAFVHFQFVDGDALEIFFLPKGTGADNKSQLRMMTPACDEDDIVRFVVDVVKQGGAEACPPLVIGVGIGGTFDTVAELAKYALLVKVGESNPSVRYAALEQKILSAVNRTGIGPQGLGGLVTALAVHIEYAPCHIGALPVAVNLQCHSHRKGFVRL